MPWRLELQLNKVINQFEQCVLLVTSALNYSPCALPLGRFPTWNVNTGLAFSCHQRSPKPTWAIPGLWVLLKVKSFSMPFA